MPESQHNEIVRKFDDEEQAKEGLITAWLAGHPCPTWENVRSLLRYEVGGEEGEKAADEVEETYIKSESDFFSTQSGVCIYCYEYGSRNDKYIIIHVVLVFRVLYSVCVDFMLRVKCFDKKLDCYLPAVTPEKARQIVDAALQDGSLPLGYLKTMAVGVTGSGKTLSKKHIFKMKADTDYSSSTGVAEAPILAFRSTSWELIKALPGVEGFDRLEFDDINQLLAEAVRKGIYRGKVEGMVEEMVKAGLEGSSDSSVGVAVGVASASGDSAAFTAVAHAVYKARKARYEAMAKHEFLPREDPVFKLQLILFLDSGGQPQFHEVVGAFSHNISLVMIYIKLNERLDALCTVFFTDEEGKWFRERCPSLLTNEQMVMQFVHTMMCKPVAGGEGLPTRFMVIGTHRDLMCPTEDLAQKNKRLKALLLPVLEDNLIMNGNDIVFPINAKDPDADDEKCFDLIREKVSDLREALNMDIPMTFLALLNDINKFAEEKEKRVVSMEECQTIAGRLKMNRQSLEAALFHFNKMSVWMYVPWILPGVVFVDPQMPLESMNHIVRHSYRVGSGEVVGLKPSEMQLWKEGVVSSEMLQGGQFSSCFVSGLFEPDHALKLFQRLYIVAPLNEREFIMPAMLQVVAKEDIQQYLPAPSDLAAPLFLHFHKSRIPNGVFGSTHACMRSKYGWTTCYTLRDGERVPACLFRNAVTLQHPEQPVKLTLVHAFGHFEAHLDAPEADLPSICAEIRDMLLDAVDSAASAFRFENSRACVAFQCPCSIGNVHTATPDSVQSNLICTQTEERLSGGFTAGQRVWLGSRNAAGECVCKCVSVYMHACVCGCVCMY